MGYGALNGFELENSTGSITSNNVLVVSLFMIATGVGALPAGITIAGSKFWNLIPLF